MTPTPRIDWSATTAAVTAVIESAADVAATVECVAALSRCGAEVLVASNHAQPLQRILGPRAEVIPLLAPMTRAAVPGTALDYAFLDGTVSVSAARATTTMLAHLARRPTVAVFASPTSPPTVAQRDDLLRGARWLAHNPGRDDVVEADDTTIVIPFRPSNPDRIDGLVAACRVWAATTTARIVVGCARPAAVRGLLPAAVEVVAVPDDEAQQFSIGGCINALATLATTAVLAVASADALPMAAEFATALRWLRGGSVDVVVPCDYPLIDVPSVAAVWLCRGDLANVPHSVRRYLGLHPVGGCVLWRRDVFTRIGMADEAFRGWGLEDDEMLLRAAACGARVARGTGPMVHFRHARGAATRRSNPHFDANRDRLVRLASMTDDEVRDEVARRR